MNVFSHVQLLFKNHWNDLNGNWKVETWNVNGKLGNFVKLNSLSENLKLLSQLFLLRNLYAESELRISVMFVSFQLDTLDWVNNKYCWFSNDQITRTQLVKTVTALQVLRPVKAVKWSAWFQEDFSDLIQERLSGFKVCTNLPGQGRKWLPKTGWAISIPARRRHLLFCQNLGGQLPTLPTRQLRPSCSWLQVTNPQYLSKH